MLSDNEIWERVKMLKGRTLETYKQNEPNKILDVLNDIILIEGRETKPAKEDIVSAYKLLFSIGELERKRDLDWLAQPNKKTSSIIFRIVGELAKDEIYIIEEPKFVLKLKTQ